MSRLQQTSITLTPCPRCGIQPGWYHHPRCPVERCPRCGGLFLTCYLRGFCLESRPEESWPPPLDDREAWTGEAPGKHECREFGWYVKRHQQGHVWVPCSANERGAKLDLGRLHRAAEWDRLEKRFVRTNLTVAFDTMLDQGLVCSRKEHVYGVDALAQVLQEGFEAIDHGEERLGFVYYTIQGSRKRQRGRDFALYFGELAHPLLGHQQLSNAEVGKLVCECLAKHQVQYLWSGDPETPIRVVTASLALLAAPCAQATQPSKRPAKPTR